jgi:hypothetical protein
MIAQWVQACEVHHVHHVGCDDYSLPRSRVRVLHHDLPGGDLVSDRPAARP